MNKEIYGGRYEVSDDGKVYTNVKYKQRREMVGKIGNSGYRMVVLTVGGKKLYKNVHRLIAEVFLDNPEGKREVNHIDGNKLNNAVSNLEWATSRENQLHVRDFLGSKSVKLSLEKSNKIRAIYAKGGITQKELARLYGVKKSIIGQIIKNERWKIT